MIDETDIASKFVRFFTCHEQTKFVLFVEVGMTRKIATKISSDHSEIELSINYPCPPDELLHKAGFEHAAKFSLEETEEKFVFEAPFGKFQNQNVDYYPNKKTPLWVFFKYDLEEEVEQATVSLNIDLTNLCGL
jgi:hypothetical protein